MLRPLAPFWGKRYVIDARNGVVHDLVHEEKLLCDIGEIPADKIHVFNSLERIERNTPTVAKTHATPCPFCMRDRYKQIPLG